jgi:magnesium-transporting ATPase (P-type)
VEDTNFGHNAELNRNLDSYAVKLIKAVGIVGVILGCLILIAFWVWVIRWLYKIW